MILKRALYVGKIILLALDSQAIQSNYLLSKYLEICIIIHIFAGVWEFNLNTWLNIALNLLTATRVKELRSQSPVFDFSCNITC